MSQRANDTKGDKRIVCPFVLRTFHQGMLRILLNYFSLTIHFGRYLKIKARLRFLFLSLVLSSGVPAWDGGTECCSFHRHPRGRPDPTGILPVAPGDLSTPISDISKKMC